MFGYITVNRKELSPAALDSYRAAYCGVCHALRRRYGSRARLMLSFDLTFVAVLLCALYDDTPPPERHRCALHPWQALPRRVNRFMDYGADMSLLLRYYLCLDHWQDEGYAVARREAERLRPDFLRLEELYPRQFQAAAMAVQQQTQLEKNRILDLDTAAQPSGLILAEIMNYQEDEWSPLLRRIGFFLGKAIYIMDAYEDLPRDRQKGCFNPLLTLAPASADKPLGGACDCENENMAALPENDPHSPKYLGDLCREYLTDLLAHAASAFERLPILDTEKEPSAALLRNVLYSGIWSRFNLCCKREKAHPERYAAPPEGLNRA